MQLSLLDNVHKQLSSGDVGEGMSDLFTGLLQARDIGGDDWQQFAKEVAITHPLRQVIHQDPMCRRSFEKPRGYAGDAVLLDYIYGLRQPTDAPEIGQAIYDFNAGRPAARAVRHRREWIAHIIDRVAENASDARVLSIACGHLREAEISAAIRNSWLDELVALDADEESLKIAETANPALVKPLPMSIGRLLTRFEHLGRFDLVYSAGLFDYLDDAIATRLTNVMFSLLAPGGRLLFSNFLPTVPDSGYMESYMGWQLLYRTTDQLAGLLDELPESEVAERRVYEDPYRSIGYVEVVRK